MRIISKNHDYYDTARAGDNDGSRVWKREPRVVEFHRDTKCPFPSMKPRQDGGFWQHQVLLGCKDKEIFKRDFNSGNNKATGSRYWVRTQIVGFCGKIYGVAIMDGGLYFDADTIIDNIKISGDKLNRENVQTYKGKIKGFFQSCESLRDSFHEEFVLNNTPIFIVREAGYEHPKADWTVEYDAELNKLGFYCVFDAYQAYQEISMFIGGVLASPSMPIPVPSDEVMRDIKGFDKFSFRSQRRKP